MNIEMKDINFWLHLLKFAKQYTNYGKSLVEIQLVNVHLVWFQSVIFENNQIIIFY